MKKCWWALFETKTGIRYSVTFPATSWKQTKKQAIRLALKKMRKYPGPGESETDYLFELKRDYNTEFRRAWR